MYYKKIVFIIIGLILISGCVMRQEERIKQQAASQNVDYINCKAYCEGYNQEFYVVEYLSMTGVWYCNCLNDEGLLVRYRYDKYNLD